MNITKLAVRSVAAGVLFIAAGAPSFAAAATPTANAVVATAAEGVATTTVLSGTSGGGGALSFATTTSPAHGTLGAIQGDGSITYTPSAAFTGTDSFSYVAVEASSTGPAATSSPATVTITVTAPAEHVTVNIRDGATLLGPWTVVLPDASTTDTLITPNEGTTSPVSVPARNLLSVLEALDAAKSEFAITDVSYYDFGAPYDGGLYLSCLSVPSATSSPLCSNCQYMINGTAPQVGAGAYALSNNDTVFLYFGSPRQVALSTSTVAAGVPFTATAESYNYVDNSFAPASGVTIGVTQPNPNDPYNPTEVATSTVGADGTAAFTLAAAGSYAVGIKEDYYSPTTSLTVTAAATSTPDAASSTPQASSPQSSGGGGGSGSYIVHSSLDEAKALAFLKSAQHTDGSFDSPLLSDWAALAFAALDPGSAKGSLASYERSAQPDLSSITDYERHAMALEALGIDPYGGTGTDYIAPIVRSFDGTQIGDPTLDNDDIFALFPLLHAGYAPSDALIAKTAAFVVSRQLQNGSWDNNADLTAAAVQGLSLTSSLPNISSALAKAESYLRGQEAGSGGFGNSFSTSWVLQAIAALGESPSSWTPSGYGPSDFLATLQGQDGGIDPASENSSLRVWATEYAIPAAEGKPWGALLASFPKPALSSAASGNSAAAGMTVATPASSSLPPLAATSTLPVATTTESLAATTAAVATTTGVEDPKRPSAPAAPASPHRAQERDGIRPLAEGISLAPKSAFPAGSAAVQSQAAAAALAPAAPANLAGRVWGFLVHLFAGIF